MEPALRARRRREGNDCSAACALQCPALIAVQRVPGPASQVPGAGSPDSADCRPATQAPRRIARLHACTLARRGRPPPSASRSADRDWPHPRLGSHPPPAFDPAVVRDTEGRRRPCLRRNGGVSVRARALWRSGCGQEQPLARATTAPGAPRGRSAPHLLRQHRARKHGM